MGGEGVPGKREPPMTWKDRYGSAATVEGFLDEVRENRDLWHRIWEGAAVDAGLLARARDLKGPIRLLVLAEDWCMDSTNTVPYVARLAEAVEGWELRILGKEENPDLMEGHLTEGKEAIPVILVLDREYRETGWWGGRPQSLRGFFSRELQDLDEDARFAGLRGWYARDAGRSALGELLSRVPPSRE
jgi:hypothetical protein